MCKGLIWLSATNRRENPDELYREIERIPGVRNVYSSRKKYEDLEQVVIEITEDSRELTEIVSDNLEELMDMIIQRKSVRTPSTVSILMSRYDTVLEWIKKHLSEIEAVREVKVVEKLDIK